MLCDETHRTPPPARDDVPSRLVVSFPVLWDPPVLPSPCRGEKGEKTASMDSWRVPELPGDWNRVGGWCSWWRKKKACQSWNGYYRCLAVDDDERTPRKKGKNASAGDEKHERKNRREVKVHFPNYFVWLEKRSTRYLSLLLVRQWSSALHPLPFLLLSDLRRCHRSTPPASRTAPPRGFVFSLPHFQPHGVGSSVVGSYSHHL